MKFLLGSLMVMLSVAIVGYNIYTWLKTGNWQPWETQVLLKDPQIGQWYNDPKDWIGLHKLAKNVFRGPWASAVLFVVGIGLVNAWLNESDPK